MKVRVFALALLIAASSLSADELADSRRLQREALTAYKEKQPAVFLEKIRAASDLRPQHPTLLVQLAVALAANGREREAVSVLDRVASMGFVYVLDDAELKPVLALPSFAGTAKRFEANARAIGTAKQELTIDRLGMIPEGMAYDARRTRWLISSVRTGNILAATADGKVETFVDLAWGVFGMAVDAKRDVLWAATAALPQVEDFRAEDKGKSALVRIDLANGHTASVGVDGDEEHHFGDVAVGADGEVYVSDSASPVIYRMVPSATGGTLEPFLRGPFASMQGIAAARNVLYVADYSKGIFAVDLRTRDVHALRVPPNASLLGVDGLYFLNDRTLIGTQNGTNPNRIIRIRLAPGGLAVSSVETLLANAPGMGDPTLGVLVGKRFFFNANAQWDLFGEDGKIADPLKLKPAVVLSVPAE